MKKTLEERIQEQLQQPVYTTVEWEDFPSENTSTDAENFNHMDTGILINSFSVQKFNTSGNFDGTLDPLIVGVARPWIDLSETSIATKQEIETEIDDKISAIPPTPPTDLSDLEAKTQKLELDGNFDTDLRPQIVGIVKQWDDLEEDELATKLEIDLEITEKISTINPERTVLWTGILSTVGQSVVLPAGANDFNFLEVFVSSPNSNNVIKIHIDGINISNGGLIQGQAAIGNTSVDTIRFDYDPSTLTFTRLYGGSQTLSTGVVNENANRTITKIIGIKETAL